jgi:MOSC domain-containing protein YiiM
LVEDPNRAQDQIATSHPGRVTRIFIGAEESGPIQEIAEVEAVAGKGLVGDRYFQVGDGAHDPALEVTLFSAEGLEAGRADSGVDITAEDLRRNLMTEGVVLSDLLGRRFSAGEVVFEGLEENPPCAHLQRLAGKPLLKPLIGRAGIRARIVSGGTIRTGDEIRPL